MSVNTTIARPYAKAVFANAIQYKTVAAWANLLQAAAAIVRHPQVTALLQNPRIPLAARLNWLLDICTPFLHEAGQNLFKLLAAKQRLIVLPEIAELFTIYRTEQEKTIKVRVVSVMPLTEALQQRLRQALQARLQREVVLEFQLDSSLLGGFIAQAGDWVIDGSIRGKLTRLSAALIK